MQYGLVFPHFGRYASREGIIEGAQRVESYGFDSVWLRDHVSYIAHPWESSDLTFIDPFVAMCAMAGVTARLRFGTAGIIPHRHPIHLAGLLGSLDHIAGPGRVIAGMAVGAYDSEFAAVGMAGWDRRELVKEQVEICRKLWAGEAVGHHGTYYSFDDAQINPVPQAGSIEVWYCGSSLAAVRRAVEYCDGWGLARLPRVELAGRLKRLRKLASEAGKRTPVVGVNAHVSPGRTRAEAEAKVDFSSLIAEAPRRFVWRPPSGRYETIDDLDGVVICGAATEIVEEVHRTLALGPEIEHFVFDLRNRFADFDSCARFLGEEVLPKLPRGAGARSAPAVAAAPAAT